MRKGTMINPEREQWCILSSLFLFLVKSYDVTWLNILDYAEALKGCVSSGARFELKLWFGTAECQTRGSAEEKQGRKKKKRKILSYTYQPAFAHRPTPPAPIPVSLYFPPSIKFQSHSKLRHYLFCSFHSTSLSVLFIAPLLLRSICLRSTKAQRSGVRVGRCGLVQLPHMSLKYSSQKNTPTHQNPTLTSSSAPG